jgi:hypothetical protein
MNSKNVIADCTKCKRFSWQIPIFFPNQTILPEGSNGQANPAWLKKSAMLQRDEPEFTDGVRRRP